MVGGDFWSRILSVLRFVDLKIQQLCPVTWFEPKPKRCRNDKIRAPVVSSKVFHQDLYLHLPQSNTIPVPIIITMSSFPCWGTLLSSQQCKTKLDLFSLASFYNFLRFWDQSPRGKFRLRISGCDVTSQWTNKVIMCTFLCFAGVVPFIFSFQHWFKSTDYSCSVAGSVRGGEK